MDFSTTGKPFLACEWHPHTAFFDRMGNKRCHVFLLLYTSADETVSLSLPFSSLLSPTWTVCPSMALSVFLPYDAADFPILSKWHVRLAMLGVASYLLLFFHLLTDIMKKDYTFYIKSMSYYTTLVILEALFFLLYGSVTALLEVSFITIMATLLYAMSENFFMSSETDLTSNS